MFKLLAVSVLFPAAFSLNRAAPTASTPATSPTSFYVALQSKGILTISFDPSKNVSSSLEITNVNPNAGFMPGWLTAHNDKVYSVSRTHFLNSQNVDGGVLSFQEHQKSNTLTQISKISSGGRGAVFCDVSRDGRTISVANIDGSVVSVHPLSTAGVIGNTSYIFKYNLTTRGPGAGDSQVQSNPHESMFDPSGKFMVVPDRGADHLYVYSVAGPHAVFQIQNITLPPGTGPRHLTFRTFNHTRTYMYLVSELDNTLRVFTLDGVSNTATIDKIPPTKNITITLQQTISTVGLGFNRTAPNNDQLAAEVALSKDGRFAYVSNRDTTSYDSDTLAVFSVDFNPHHDHAHVKYLGENATYGKIPRHFALSPDPQNRYVAIGNEVSQSLIVLERDTETGFITGLKGNLTLGDLDVTQSFGPTCILWT